MVSSPDDRDFKFKIHRHPRTFIIERTKNLLCRKVEYSMVRTPTVVRTLKNVLSVGSFVNAIYVLAKVWNVRVAKRKRLVVSFPCPAPLRQLQR